MIRNRQLRFLFVYLMSCSLNAKDLGVHGALFLITEPDLLDVIQERLKGLENSGKLIEVQQRVTQRIQERVLHPECVSNVNHTVEPRHFLWDPTLIVEEDIQDHYGRTLIAKGTKINPLDHVQWGNPILFIDGEAEEHVAYAQNFKDQKLILVKGKPLQLEQQLKYPVYFDQGGVYVKKFGIRQVPCRISQHGKKLLVEEIKITNKREENKK